MVRLHRYYCGQQSDYRIVFVPEPARWTEVPGTMGIYASSDDDGPAGWPRSSRPSAG